MVHEVVGNLERLGRAEVVLRGTLGPRALHVMVRLFELVARVTGQIQTFKRPPGVMADFIAGAIMCSQRTFVDV